VNASNRARPSRPFRQENVMKMLRVAAFVLAASALITPALPADDKSERDQALAEIMKLKGTVVKFPFSVSFDNKRVTDDALVHLQKLPDLEAVYLRKCQVTDKGLENLKGLTGLKYLYLGQTQVTDKGLENLKGLAKLETLSLVGTQVTDAGLVHLKELRGLRLLEVKNTKVTPDGVAELKKSLPELIVC
jgi:hypothetical protein